jgi:hypothetical protein
MDIDPSKLVYMDTKYFDKLQDLARSKLIEMGFDKNQLVFAPDAAKYGETGHYIARIWKSKEGTTLTVSQMESIEDMIPGNHMEILGGESSPSFGHMVRGKTICEVDLDIPQER